MSPRRTSGSSAMHNSTSVCVVTNVHPPSGRSADSIALTGPRYTNYPNVRHLLHETKFWFTVPPPIHHWKGSRPMAVISLSTSTLEIRVFLALAVVLAVSRAVGWAISKNGQPQVHGEILAGIILGPSLVGWVWPQALSYLFPAQVITFLNVLAQVAVVLFMFLVGLSLDL